MFAGPRPPDRRPVHTDRVHPVRLRHRRTETAWRSLIATLEQSLRLHRHQPGTLVEHSDYLYERTGGAIGSLSVLIRGAAVLAIEDETEQITLDLLNLIHLDHTATSTTPVRRRKTKGRS